MLRSALAILLMATTSLQANELRLRRQLTVVYDGPSTVPAQPYYRRLERQPEKKSSVFAPAGSQLISLENRLPLTTHRLRVGRPDMSVKTGIVIPVFVMGMDRVSLTWFEQAAKGLAEIGARGVVVQADSVARWHSLRQGAEDLGITLTLLNGDSLALGYGIETYPVVIVSPQLAQKAGDE